jgi:guanidinopropionase
MRETKMARGRTSPTMKGKQAPMLPGRKASLPLVYGDTPSFLGCPVLRGGEEGSGYDAVVAGVPWEGTVTWGSFSGCELAPRTIRHASARYGGFLPEYEVDLFDHLRIADMGDVPVDPQSPERTMASVHRWARRIYRAGAIPIFLGGDHSFSPEVVRALAATRKGRIGIIHFDSHLDNSPSFGADLYPRCGPLHRIARIGAVKKSSIVHLAIRGPRNSPAQLAYAKELGCSVFTIRHIRERGMEAVMDEALAIARKGTDHLYVTICSDCIDAAFNPGGPADFNGLFPHELFAALVQLGRSGIDGLDYVEVYPTQDPASFSSHLAAWAVVHALVGKAMGKAAAGKRRHG